MHLTGLTEKEAKIRLGKYGLNEIKDIDRVSTIKILLRQIRNNFIIYLLLIASVLSFIVEKSLTGYTIILLIFVIIGVGFFQEYKAEKAIKSLKSMITPVSIVIRDGKEKEILSGHIVSGDLIVLRNGEKIPADCLILEEKELMVNESILTGESQEVKKIVSRGETNYKENSLLFMGTFIVNGRAIAKVIHTGMNTKFGKIAALISKEEKNLPLQNKINHLSKYLAFIAILLSLIVGMIMIAKGSISSGNLIEILIVVIALSVSAFPEGLPLVLAITLATGAYRMAKKNAIVNRMSIIETLGETTVICSDKTGTITKGEMTVKKVFMDNRIIEVSGAGYEATGDFTESGKKLNLSKDKHLEMLLKAGVLCNDSKIERRGDDNFYNIIGNSTEASLMILAAKAAIFKEDLNSERKEEIPFSSARKLMSVLCRLNSESYVFTKGAPELLIEKCRKIQTKQGIFTLTEKNKKQILESNKKFTSSAYRTLALAYKKIDRIDKDHFEKDLIFLGIVAIEDPPREEVREAISLCRTAGIKVKMITGDNKETAISIARQIGLYGNVMTGEEIEKLSEDELKKVIDTINIFVRVKPENKLRIVNALKMNGEIVTMTGDGVNDAPALKASHIGVAMGRNGTDVSRDVADLTLKDDNFSTIVSAVTEGRTIFNNMRKFIAYLLSCNYSEIVVISLAVIIGLPLPLIAIQILFMNLLTDSLPDIALALNPSSEDIMQQKPRKTSKVLTKEIFLIMALAGSIMSLGTLVVFYLTLSTGNSIVAARTTAMITLIFFQIANAFNFRSFRKGVLSRSPFVNLPLVYASLASIIATIAIVNLPALNKIFETAPIGLSGWVYAFAASFSVILIFDILKAINGRKHIWEEYF